MLLGFVLRKDEWVEILGGNSFISLQSREVPGKKLSSERLLKRNGGGKFGQKGNSGSGVDRSTEQGVRSLDRRRIWKVRMCKWQGMGRELEEAGKARVGLGTEPEGVPEWQQGSVLSWPCPSPARMQRI